MVSITRLVATGCATAARPLRWLFEAVDSRLDGDARSRARARLPQASGEPIRLPVPLAPTLNHSFLREVELADAVLTWLNEQYPDAVIGHELDFRWGAPDLVAGEPTALADRLASSVAPLLNPHAVAVLRRAALGPLREDELRGMTSLRWHSYVERILSPLCDAGLLDVDADGASWRAGHPLIEPFGVLVAVELKLRDWRKAMAQAARYRTFAEETWVAMPASRISRALLAMAHRQGVGVLAVHDTGASAELQAARGDALDPSMRGMASEQLLASFLGARPVRPAGSPRGVSLAAC